MMHAGSFSTLIPVPAIDSWRRRSASAVIASVSPLLVMLPFLQGCGDEQAGEDPAAAETSAPLVAREANEARDSCGRAHEAYLRSDFRALSHASADCLEGSPDPLVRANVTALLEAAYVLRAGKLPADTRLPPGFAEARLVQRRMQSGPDGAVKWSIQVEGKLAAARAVEEVTLTDASGATLLSLGDPGLDFGGRDDWFYLKKDAQEPLPDGLYFLTLKSVGAERLTQRVLAVGWVAGAAPVVTSPVAGATIVDSNPTFAWEECERTAGRDGRTWQAKIVHSDPPGYEWKPAWEARGAVGSATSTRVGRDTVGRGELALAPGRYLSWFVCRESRSFGAIAVARESGLKGTFFVRP